jgi:hypothetical protein
MTDALETVADAIDLARYQHPEHPRERLRPFSEADRSDREYAIRLARAALAAAQAGATDDSEVTRLKELFALKWDATQSAETAAAEARGFAAGIEAAADHALRYSAGRLGALADEIRALRPAESEPFDITDGRHRYLPCPRCGATLNMGLCHRDDMLAVQCGYCQFRGPEVAGRVSEQKDRCAFNAWNALSLAQLAPSPPSASEPAGALKCRFGCDAPVYGVYSVPKGCLCWDDPVQALCRQHFITAESAGHIYLIWSPEPAWPSEEDVARAIALAWRGDEVDRWDELPGGTRERYRNGARAVLALLRRRRQ